MRKRKRKKNKIVTRNFQLSWSSFRKLLERRNKKKRKKNKIVTRNIQLSYPVSPEERKRRKQNSEEKFSTSQPLYPFCVFYMWKPLPIVPLLSGGLFKVVLQLLVPFVMTKYYLYSVKHNEMIPFSRYITDNLSLKLNCDMYPRKPLFCTNDPRKWPLLLMFLSGFLLIISIFIDILRACVTLGSIIKHLRSAKSVWRNE